MFSASKTAAPAVSGAYSVKQSLRFRSSASAYLNRTPASASNRTTWTWSGWVKRGIIGTGFETLFAAGTGLNSEASIRFNSTDTVEFYSWTGAMDAQLLTTQVFRDTSAWYHLVAVFDTSNAVANQRIRLYINGAEVLTFSSRVNPAQNYNGYVNNSIFHATGNTYSGSSRYFDGYMAEINFIDGQALTPSSFGAYNATTGVWQPARYTGSYGTNGFYLTFGNKTSTTTLGNDTSGNGNNWTTNNISLTAGSTYDSMLDSPTNYDDGGNGVGNYCVWNPLDTSGSTINANLSVSTSGFSGYGTTRATFGMSSGKWYWEVTPTSFGDGGIIGIATSSAAISAALGVNAYGWAYLNGGSKYTNNVLSSYGSSYTTNDVIGVAFDADAGTLTFYKNNTSQGVAFSGLTSGPYFPAVSDNGGGTTGSVFAVTFGQRPFAYTPPSGFKALNTQNLPTPAIVNGSAHMNVALDTGANIKTTSQALYTYYLEWIKDRANVNNHQLADTVRGNTAILQSNTTAVETTYTAPSGNSVGWVWNANAAAVSNTSGTITSQVSANTTAGFSVVTYTGTGANATVGHGLGVAPSFLIVKNRSSVAFWDVWHTSLGGPNSTSYLYLNSTAAAGADGATTFWGANSFNSSTFSVGPNASANGSGNSMVAYCFAAIAGYSAFGSYTGNGSTDGPFVYLGFRPRYVLVKCTSNAAYGYWDVIDTSRDPYNAAFHELFPNDSSAEYTGGRYTDILSNGFKQRASAYANVNGETYIYACFAENPFKYSLAR